jgi:hypothetical protein
VTLTDRRQHAGRLERGDAGAVLDVEREQAELVGHGDALQAQRGLRTGVGTELTAAPWVKLPAAPSCIEIALSPNVMRLKNSTTSVPSSRRARWTWPIASASPAPAARTTHMAGP